MRLTGDCSHVRDIAEVIWQENHALGKLPREQLVSEIQDGATYYTITPDGQRAEVEVYRSRDGWLIRTKGGAVTDDNLLSLPKY